MNILVTGSDGQLGRALRRASVASSDRYFFTDVAGDDTLRLDITDADAVEGFVREHGIGVIVNCAAYTNVDRAEDDAARAELLNATAAYPNFILSSGCDVPPETPHANIDAFYKALSEYNKTTNRYR